MTSNGLEKNAARGVASELEITYTHALRLIRTARKDSPQLRGTYLRNRCKELLEAERKGGRR